ncbi:cytochrome P450 [Trichoderma sp. SZMC 28011]
MSGYKIVAAALFGAAIWLIRLLVRERSPKLNFPVMGSASDSEFSQAVLKGFEKANTPFIIPANPQLVILPMSMYMESKTHPAADVSAERNERFMGHWTCAGVQNAEIYSAIRQDLSKNLNIVLPLIQDETKYAFKELKIQSEWTSVNINSAMLRMIALISGRVFVGSPLSRSEEWLDASINYTRALSKVQDDYLGLGPVLSNIAAPFLSSVWKARGYMTKAQTWMRPLVAEILASEKSMDGPSKAGVTGCFISWLLKYIPDAHKTATRVGEDQMIVSFAAIHTTSNTAAMAILDLASRPQYIGELREEVETVVAEGGEQNEDGNIYLGKAAFAKMKKLDSFIKESQRFNSLAFVTPAYKLLSNATFSNGIKLPKGTRITFPHHGLAMSTTNKAFSPENNVEAGNAGPDVFDGFRYARLRELPGLESKHQAASTGLDNLTFGHGPHACPGRFFAIYEVKNLLVELLLNYDFRLASTVDGHDKEAIRPANIAHKISNMPNPCAVLEVRARRA